MTGEVRSNQDRLQGHLHVSLPLMLTSTSDPAFMGMRNNGCPHAPPGAPLRRLTWVVPAVRITGAIVSACYTSSLLGASIHPLLLRKQGKQGDLPTPRKAIFIGSLINQAVESWEKTG